MQQHVSQWAETNAGQVILTLGGLNAPTATTISADCISAGAVLSLRYSTQRDVKILLHLCIA